MRIVYDTQFAPAPMIPTLSAKPSDLHLVYQSLGSTKTTSLFTDARHPLDQHQVEQSGPSQACHWNLSQLPIPTTPIAIDNFSVTLQPLPRSRRQLLCILVRHSAPKVCFSCARSMMIWSSCGSTSVPMPFCPSSHNHL